MINKNFCKKDIININTNFYYKFNSLNVLVKYEIVYCHCNLGNLKICLISSV